MSSKKRKAIATTRLKKPGQSNSTANETKRETRKEFVLTDEWKDQTIIMDLGLLLLKLKGAKFADNTTPQYSIIYDKFCTKCENKEFPLLHSSKSGLWCLPCGRKYNGTNIPVNVDKDI